MSVSGILLYDKPAGPTSFSALGGLKRALGTTKLGHTGTLDSFATGLLVVLVGSYSRLAPWFVGLDKEYEAEIAFGSETDTLDPGGRVLERAPVPSPAALASILPEFTGSLLQTPPRYSAIHIEGSRASERARKGEVFELKPRAVSIRFLELLSFEEGRARIRLGCSSGTYVRSLARDMAIRLGSRAHLASLRRTCVGPFRVEDAAQSEPRLKPMTPGLARSIGLEAASLPRGRAGDFASGKLSALSLLQPIPPPDIEAAVFSAEEGFLGIAGWKDGRLGFSLVMPGLGAGEAGL